MKFCYTKENYFTVVDFENLLASSNLGLQIYLNTLFLHMQIILKYSPYDKRKQ